MQKPQQPTYRYVLVTAAYNEGRLIESTIRSVISQEQRPSRWVIVSDNSTDSTDKIVSGYSADYPFIQWHRLTQDHPRNFAAQAFAINAGLQLLASTEFDFIGNLDADITLAPQYFGQLISKFREDPQLGLAGGAIHEQCPDGVFRERPDNSVTSVAHAVQLFRRACFYDVGESYKALPYGGPDTYAEVTARMKGWRVSTFPELAALHHRMTGSAGGMMRGCFRQGRMDYSLSTLPLFELFKVLRRILVKPYLIGSAARFAGFVSSYWRRDKRSVSDEFTAYFQQEQKARLFKLVGRTLTQHIPSKPSMYVPPRAPELR